MARERFDKLTRDLLESEGWLVEKTEHWNAHAGKTKDFMGFGDFIISKPKLTEKFPGDTTVAVQVCREADWTTRRAKILKSGKALVWLLCGRGIWIMGWKVTKVRKPDAAGRMRLAKHYEPKTRLVTPADFRGVDSIDLPIDIKAEDVLRAPHEAHRVHPLNALVMSWVNGEI